MTFRAFGLNGPLRSGALLINGTFIDNSATYEGGGIFNWTYSSPTVRGCTFNGNTAGSGGGGGMHNDNCCDPIVTGCTFSNNFSHQLGGGGMYNDNSNPMVINCDFSENLTDISFGGGMGNYQSDPIVSNCTFRNNTSDGGGGISNYLSSPTVTNCIFYSNSVDYGGGGGIRNKSSHPTVTNCTFFCNSSTDEGGGICNDNSNPVITNCILWRDIPDEIYNVNASVVVTYSDIQGGYMGEGNIDIYPEFVNVANSDYHLRWDSPCINVGDPNYIPEEGETDIDNEPRVMGSRVDMGADEVGPKQSDFTRDGIININDFAVLGNSWQTIPVDENWYILSDLWEDDVIDIGDLAAFVEDWMWVAEWHQ